jgi:Cu(I)-responsive transcriptional regulator
MTQLINSSAEPRLNIGEAAARSGVSAKMLRHYESLELLPTIARSESGYRQYSERDVHIVRFIRHARDLGFKINEITQLLKLWQDQGRSSADVKRIAATHLADLERRMAEMAAMQRSLQNLVKHCQGDKRPDCPILDGLDEAAARQRGQRGK